MNTDLVLCGIQGSSVVEMEIRVDIIPSHCIADIDRQIASYFIFTLTKENLSFKEDKGSGAILDCGDNMGGPTFLGLVVVAAKIQI